MRYELTLTDRALRELLAGVARDPRLRPAGPLAYSHLRDRVELLGADVPWHVADDAPARLIVAGVHHPAALSPALTVAIAAAAGATGVALVLGVGPAAGRVAAAYIGSRPPAALHALRIVGPGLPLLPLTADDTPVPHPADDEIARAVWSRSIGALGEATWRRLSELRVAIVGCGRTGSLVAAALNRAGPAPRLTLIDPDLVEPHNLGEMDLLSWADVGQPKVHALAAALPRQAPLPNRAHLPSDHEDCRGDSRIEAVPFAVLSLPGLVAVKRADVLVSCPDNAAARLLAGVLSALYLKPLLDIGTGIHTAAPADLGTARAPRPMPRHLGFDVRLLVPGGPGACQLCAGGVGDLAGVRFNVGADAELPLPNWRDQRLGSLRSLNGLAAHSALRLLEDYVAGRLGPATWLHLAEDLEAVPQLERIPIVTRPGCVLCALIGQGDDGLELVPSLLSSATV